MHGALAWNRGHLPFKVLRLSVYNSNSNYFYICTVHSQCPPHSAPPCNEKQQLKDEHIRGSGWFNMIELMIPLGQVLLLASAILSKKKIIKLKCFKMSGLTWNISKTFWRQSIIQYARSDIVLYVNFKPFFFFTKVVKFFQNVDWLTASTPTTVETNGSQFFS